MAQHNMPTAIKCFESENSMTLMARDNFRARITGETVDLDDWE